MNKRDLKKELKNWITRNYGKRCPDYCSGCVICDMWKHFDELFETIDDKGIVTCPKCKGWGWVKK